jgi:hypothetical protein
MIKQFARTWVSLVSMVGFLLVWLYLARASEPRDNQGTPQPNPTSPTATVVLPPVPDIDALVAAVTITPGNIKSFNLIIPSPLPTGAPTSAPPVIPPTVLPTQLATIVPMPQPTAIPTLQATANIPTATPWLRTGGS